MTMKLHKYCSLFPPITGKELSELVEDMRTSGQRDEITTFEGEILDGQNRANACEVLGIKPKTKPFKGTEAEALAFVISKNMTRRHLDIGERAMIALELTELSNGKVTMTAAAEQMGVARSTAHEAQTVKNASPALAKKVKAGKMTLNAAAQEVKKKKGKTDKNGGQQAPELSPAHSGAKTDGGKAGQGEAPETKTTGQICHDAFIEAIGGTELWADLDSKGKEAWQTAADAVKGAI